MAWKKGFSYLVDACLIAGVLASGLYLASNSGEEISRDSTGEEDRVFEGAPPLTENGQEIRDCPSSFVTTIQVVVDLSFTATVPMQPVDPSEAEDIGDKLLDLLVEQCYCNNSQDCLLWTLTISEFKYSKSDFSNCQKANLCKITKSYPLPTHRVNTTIAKVFVLGRHALNPPDCQLCTVENLLENAAAYLPLQTYNQVFLGGIEESNY